MNIRFIYRWLIQSVIMEQKTKEERETTAKRLSEMLKVVPRFNENRFLEGYLTAESRRSRLEIFKNGGK